MQEQVWQRICSFGSLMDRRERNGQGVRESAGAPEAELVRWDQVRAERVSRGQKALKQHGAV